MQHLRDTRKAPAELRQCAEEADVGSRISASLFDRKSVNTDEVTAPVLTMRTPADKHFRFAEEHVGSVCRARLGVDTQADGAREARHQREVDWIQRRNDRQHHGDHRPTALVLSGPEPSALIGDSAAGRYRSNRTHL